MKFDFCSFLRARRFLKSIISSKMIMKSQDGGICSSEEFLATQNLVSMGVLALVMPLVMGGCWHMYGFETDFTGVGSDPSFHFLGSFRLS